MKIRNCICILTIVISVQLNAQISQLSIKAGANVSGRTNASNGNNEGMQKIGFQIMVEPTICSWGKNKQFNLNTDVGLFQKGYKNKENIYSYNGFGQVTGIGQEVNSIAIYYFTFSPIVKYKFAKIAFIKAGPTGDYLLNYKYSGRPSSEFIGDNRIQIYAAGVTLGGGVCVGKKNVQFITELMGQRDFISSSYNNRTRENFRNYSYYINFGIAINFKKNKE